MIGEEELAKIMQVCTAIQNTLVFPKAVRYVDLTNPPRRLLRQGELKKKGNHSLIKTNGMRDIFLFKDVLVVTSQPDFRGKRKVSAVLNLSICELSDPFAEPGADVCSFEVIDPSVRSVLLIATNTKEKRSWLYSIARAIMAHMDQYVTVP